MDRGQVYRLAAILLSIGWPVCASKQRTSDLGCARRHGYSSTFLVTAILQAAGCLCYFALLGMVPAKEGHAVDACEIGGEAYYDPQPAGEQVPLVVPLHGPHRNSDEVILSTSPIPLSRSAPRS